MNGGARAPVWVQKDGPAVRCGTKLPDLLRTVDTEERSVVDWPVAADVRPALRLFGFSEYSARSGRKALEKRKFSFIRAIASRSQCKFGGHVFDTCEHELPF